jgi:hypothetical protein
VPKAQGVISRMNVVGKPTSKGAAASNRPLRSGGSSNSTAPRLSRSWSARRAPTIGWMAGLWFYGHR